MPMKRAQEGNLKIAATVPAAVSENQPVGPFGGNLSGATGEPQMQRVAR
jgi:hypothetical protein